ncbi:hypothetical protein ACTXT7_016543 [Hymenolepis weldensis]
MDSADLPYEKRASKLAPISNAMQLYVLMLHEATFQEKTIFKERKLNLSDIYSRTYECGKSCERKQPASKCCQNFPSFYSYSIAETRFSQDSALTYHSEPTQGATCTTVINSHLKGPAVTLLSPITSRSAISIFNKLVVYQKRSLRTQVHSLNQYFA